eukprot:880399-Prymnesium_polylepis.1
MCAACVSHPLVRGYVSACPDGHRPSCVPVVGVDSRCAKRCVRIRHHDSPSCDTHWATTDRKAEMNASHSRQNTSLAD